MELSIFLAKSLGLYLIIISVAFFTQERRLKQIMVDMINGPSLMLISGFIALVVGILLVVSHNIWVKDWRVIITIVGWMALLKGLNIILFPKILSDLSIKWMQSKFAYYVTFLFTFIVGIVLVYFGYGES